ncbi:MAG: low-specificity L-threonine aldolase [Pirellulales bacterium]
MPQPTQLDVDLRSDTVTKPCRAMREAMVAAEVGDDVFGSDPTVNALQEQIADMLGKEAALFTPSGSMANQIAIRLHCGRGEEFICEQNCHILLYEQGGYSQLSGAIAKPISGSHGVIQLSQLPAQLPPLDDHVCRTKLLTIENTHNRGGGKVQPLETVRELCSWARRLGLATHLDGARLFNAVVASGDSARDWAAPFDTINVCFSKGLGAPVGSAIVGSKEMIREARRIRKLLGGGMRQVGILAAAAIYALKNNIQRLEIDHQHAKLIAEAVSGIDGLSLEPQPETNIVIVRVATELGSPAALVAALANHGIGAVPFGPRHIRMVTHLDITRQQIERVCECLPLAVSSICEV